MAISDKRVAHDIGAQLPALALPVALCQVVIAKNVNVRFVNTQKFQLCQTVFNQLIGNTLAAVFG